LSIVSLGFQEKYTHVHAQMRFFGYATKLGII